MTPPEENNHGLITTGTGGLIRRMDQLLELVGRLLHEIESKNLIRIDLEMATKFLADPNAVDLSKGQILDDDAAEVLSRHRGALVFDGLTSLSDAAAGSLSRLQGQHTSAEFYARHGIEGYPNGQPARVHSPSRD